MFSDRFEILDQLTKLVDFHKKSSKDSNPILDDLQNIINEINADIDEEAYAYEAYQETCANWN